jgi:hypothetical protein
MNIEDYEFTDIYKPKVLSLDDEAVLLDTENIPLLALFKDDVIALAKHFNVTANDLGLPSTKDLQDDLNLADEIAFDECAALRVQISDLNNKLKIRKSN